MKAARLININEPLQVDEVDIPVLNQNEVKIAVAFSSINRRDIWISKGQYAQIITPCILGSDTCGIVVEVGKEVDKSWLHKEVVVNPNIGWGQSSKHQSKEYSILGMPSAGTFAEYIVVREHRLSLKPQHLSLEEASVLPLAGLTAYRALFTKGRLQSGEKVLISGVGGGVASMALQFCLAKGCKVYVTSGSQAKIDKAISLGAEAGFNYKDHNWHKVLRQQFGGIDLVIDSAGGSGFKNFLDLMNPGGRIVFYGGTNGLIEGVSPQKIFWKQLSIIGTTMGSDDDFLNMIQCVSRYKTKPIVDQKFELTEVNQAFEYILSGKQFGKVSLKIKA